MVRARVPMAVTHYGKIVKFISWRADTEKNKTTAGSILKRYTDWTGENGIIPKGKRRSTCFNDLLMSIMGVQKSTEWEKLLFSILLHFNDTGIQQGGLLRHSTSHHGPGHQLARSFVSGKCPSNHGLAGRRESSILRVYVAFLGGATDSVLCSHIASLCVRTYSMGFRVVCVAFCT